MNPPPKEPGDAHELELSHLRYVLADLETWDREEVPERAQRWVRQRYTARAEALWRGEEQVPVALEEAVPESVPVVQVQEEPLEPEVVATAAQSPSHPVEPLELLVGAFEPEPGPAPEPLPAGPSKWERVWRPFLYESIGWFVGGFLVLAGTFYFVAESWASATQRASIVAALTAAYSIGFSVWGGFLRRREALLHAGQVIGLIGAAIAPLAGLALAPLASTLPFVFWPVLIAWAACSTFLVGGVARSIDADTVVPLRLGGALTTFALGAVPTVAPLGTVTLWSAAVPLLLLGWSARASRKEGGRRAFAMLAPLYLAVLYAVRVHLALAEVGTPVAPGTWACFGALAIAAALEGYAIHRRRAAEALEIAAVAALASCLAMSAFGEPPAFFLTSVILGGVAWRFSRGEGARIRWLYVAYAAAHLAYQSCGQLVPGILRELAERVKLALGYSTGDPLPFNFDAVYAVPFVVGAAVLASRLSRRNDERSQGIVEVLLRATTVLGGLLVPLAASGPDLRAGLWSVPAVGITLGVLGLRFSRPFLTWTACALLATVPLFAWGAAGTNVAAGIAGLGALALAGVSLRVSAAHRIALGLTVGVLGVTTLGMVMTSLPSVLGGVFVLAAGVATVMVARKRESALGMALAGALMLCAVPILGLAMAPGWAPHAVAGSGLVAVLVSRRWSPLTSWIVPGLVAGVAGALWAFLGSTDFYGLALLFAAAAFFVGAHRSSLLHVPAALALSCALVPTSGDWTPWPMMAPRVSALLLLAVAGAALVGAVRTSRARTWAYGVGVVGAGLVTLLHGVQWEIVGLLTVAFLLTSRSVHPWFGIPLAALVAIVGEVDTVPNLLVVAGAFTALAWIQEWEPGRRLLGGRANVGLPAAFGALLAMCAWALLSVFGAEPVSSLKVVLIAAMLLVQLRPARAFWWAALLVPTVLLATAEVDEVTPWIAGCSIAVVLLTRVIAHVPTAARWMLGSEERDAWKLQIAVLVSTVFLLLRDPTSPWVIAAVLFGASRGVTVRIAIAAFLSAFVEGGVFIGPALALLGIAERFAPRAVQRALGADGPFDARALPVVAVVGAALSFAVTRDATAAAALASTLVAAAFLLDVSWLLGGALLAGAGAQALATGELGWTAAVWALGAAIFARVLVHRRIWASWGLPLATAAIALAGVSLIAFVAESPTSVLPPLLSVIGGLTALLVFIDRHEWCAVGGGVLLAGTAAMAVPAGWGALGIATVGVGVAAWALWRDAVPSRVLAIALAAVSLVGLHALEHPSAPLIALCAAAVTWVEVRRNARLEPLGWVISVCAVHVMLFYAGLALSTGRPDVFILPYVGAATLLVASVVRGLRVTGARRWTSLALMTLGFTELTAGWVLISGPVPLEAAVALVGIAAAVTVLLWRGAKEDDEASVWWAQAGLLLGYVIVRGHAMGADAAGTADSLVAVGVGVVLAGVHAWAHRMATIRACFRRPLVASAFAFPIVGLLAAPWGEPVLLGALLLVHAAHFSLLSATSPWRRSGAVLAFVAFNGAVLAQWWGTRLVELQYVAIPAGLAALGLLAVFARELPPLVVARVRAVCITVIYAASAWRPLTFEHGWAMLVCVAVCVVGMAAGVLFRIRSYVFLGCGFLVTTVLANLVRFGVRDHRIGALFLSLLGLIIVAAMVFISARRAELGDRWRQARRSLDTWSA